MRNLNLLKPMLLGVSLIALSGCSLASLPKGYSDIEKQTVNQLATSNYTPRSALEREAILTQDLFAQAAFWSHEYDLNPADLEAAVNLSSALRRLNNPAKSIEVATQTRALYPRDPDLLAELGASYVASDNPHKAIEMIDKALHHRPQLARLWSIKGAALDQLEHFDQARQHYTKALQLAPNDSGIMANVGLSYALEGDPNTAEIWLRRAANAPGATASVRQNLALVLELVGKKKEANTWANKKTSAPTLPSKPMTAPIQQNALPQHGARLSMAGDTSRLTGGPKTASEMARHMMKNKASASQGYKPMRAQAPTQPRQTPQSRTHNPYANRHAAHTHNNTVQPQNTAQPPQNILSKIAGNNRSKRDIAAQQYKQLQNRQQQKMAQQNPQPYPQIQQLPQTNMQYQPQQQHMQIRQGQMLQGQRRVPQEHVQHPYQRPPARTRRR